MRVEMWINGQKVCADIAPDLLLLDFLRQQGMYSVKRGCETSNCGLCTVFVEERPVLSCSMLAARAAGRHVVTLEGLQGGSGGVWRVYCRSGGGTVRILQSGLCDVRHRPVPGKTGSFGAGDTGIFGGKSLPVFRL